MTTPVVVTLRRLTYEEEQRLALDMVLCKINRSRSTEPDETSEDRAEAMRAERKEQRLNKPVVL